MPAETANHLIPQQEGQEIRSAGFDSSNESDGAATFRSILFGGDGDAASAMNQSDEKVLAYATGNPRFKGVESYTEVAPHVLLEIEHFFSVYKDMEGKRTKVLGWKDRETAQEIIRASHQRYLHRNAS